MKNLIAFLFILIPILGISQKKYTNKGEDTRYVLNGDTLKASNEIILDCTLQPDVTSRSFIDFERKVAHRKQQKALKSSSSVVNEPKQIPIVVNIIHKGEPEGVGSNFSDEFIIDLVATLDATFEYSNTVWGFEAPQESTGFDFFLAFEDENGNPINPIRRFDRNNPYLSEGDPSTAADDWPAANIDPFAYTSLNDYIDNPILSVSDRSRSVDLYMNQFMRFVGYEPEKFMNITIVDWEGSLGGVGSFPFESYLVGEELEGGGNFYSRKDFGLFMRSGSVANPNFVTYLTSHEMGHCLGLLHTFQSNGCPIAEYSSYPDCQYNGDRVCDTPPVLERGLVPCESEQITLPNASSNCTNGDIDQYLANMNSDAKRNYMDYNSGCDYLIFTPGQIDRAHVEMEEGRQLMIQVGSAITSNQEGQGGCTDIIACNFDSEADWNNGSCQYPDFGYTCEGNCISDSDGDGVCDLNEYVGCMDPDKCNYLSYATDPGPCLDEDVCGVCGGPGDIYECGCNPLPELACDCQGNFDYNNNGICDNEEEYPAPGDDVTQVEITECPGDFDLSLMLDVSGSMEDEQWQAAIQATRDIVNYFYPLFEGNHLRLGFFGWSSCDYQNEWLAPSNSWSQINIMLDYLETTPAPLAGGTKVSAALTFAYDQFTDISVYNPNSAKVIIVVSDAGFQDISQGHLCSQGEGALFPIFGSLKQFANKIKSGSLQFGPNSSRASNVSFKILGIVIPNEGYLPGDIPLSTAIENMECITNNASTYPVTSYETIYEILPELGESFCLPQGDCDAITSEFISFGYVNPSPYYTQSDKLYIPGNPAPSVSINGVSYNTTDDEFGGWNRLIGSESINASDGPHYVEAEYIVNETPCVFYDTLSCQLPINFGPSQTGGWINGTADDQKFVFKPSEGNTTEGFKWYVERYNEQNGNFAPYLQWHILKDSEDFPVQNKLGEFNYTIDGQDVTIFANTESGTFIDGIRYEKYKLYLNQTEIDFVDGETYQLKISCSYGCEEIIEFTYTVPPLNETNPCSPFDLTMQISYLGSTYDLVAIGDRCWFKQDLRNSVNNDGQSIYFANDEESWAYIFKNSIPAYTESNRDDALELGLISQADYDNFQWSPFQTKLYNWYVLDNVCPEGWHPADNSDWNNLEASLFGARPLKLRSESQEIEVEGIKDSLFTKYEFFQGQQNRFNNGEWPSSSTISNNLGLKSGLRNGSGDFNNYVYSKYWWTNNSYPARVNEFQRQNSAWARGFTIVEDFDNMYNSFTPGWKIDKFMRYMNLWSTSNNKNNALCIKCVKDVE